MLLGKRGEAEQNPFDMHDSLERSFMAGHPEFREFYGSEFPSYRDNLAFAHVQV